MFKMKKKIQDPLPIMLILVLLLSALSTTGCELFSPKVAELDSNRGTI